MLCLVLVKKKSMLLEGDNSLVFLLIDNYYIFSVFVICTRLHRKALQYVFSSQTPCPFPKFPLKFDSKIGTHILRIRNLSFKNLF